MFANLFIFFGLEMEKAQPCIHLDVAAIEAKFRQLSNLILYAILAIAGCFSCS